MSDAGQPVRKLPADPGRPAGADLIYKNVLDNVASGILSLDSRGAVNSFNAKAAEITGLSTGEVLGRSFVEVFQQLDGADEFTDAILDAVYNALEGHRTVVRATFADRTLSLSVATAYLKEQRGTETVGVGVVVVFDDISEIRELREKEVRLAREVEGKHAELRDAYLTLEDRNRDLNAALKRVNAAKIGATAFVLALFVALGLYAWYGGARPEISAAGAATASGEGLRTVTVEPQPVSATIVVTGRLAPRRKIEVTSPIQAKVAALHFRYGERVEKGQRLVDLDVRQTEIDYGDARIALIKAEERVKELEDWSNHVEVSRARRAVSKSRVALDTRKNRLAETAFLLERGVIPASEHEAAEREHRNRELDLLSAEEDLAVLLAKGVTDLRVALLELESARTRAENLEDIMRRAAIHAPAAGVVLQPEDEEAQGGSGERKDGLATGASVNRGDLLLTIGDLGGLTVVGRVDEVDIARIRPGQAARIVGDAFPGVELRGAITSVSAQAKRGGGSRRSLPYFEIAAAVENLSSSQRELLRLGMSADLEIVVYKKADALLVPIDAVETRDGRTRLRISDRESGETRHVEVVAGVTTVDAVEIVSGIAAGDEIVVSGP